jgi:hypothetical protein
MFETISYISRQHGVEIDTVRKRFKSLFPGEPFSQDRQLTDAEASVLFAKELGRKYTRKKPEYINGHAPERPAEKTRKTSRNFRAAFLWLCLLLSLLSSVPNMYGIILAIKGNSALAWINTAAFTVAPFLLIGAGVKNIGKAVPFVIIALEVFCNTTGFYQGMTGLENSLFIRPNLFLNTVTTMLNSAYEPTAFLVSLFMAACIALLAIVPANELRK